jgi:hypothetical protein
LSWAIFLRSLRELFGRRPPYNGFCFTVTIRNGLFWLPTLRHETAEGAQPWVHER